MKEHVRADVPHVPIPPRHALMLGKVIELCRRPWPFREPGGLFDGHGRAIAMIGVFHPERSGSQPNTSDCLATFFGLARKLKKIAKQRLFL
jgi:hypothetical protein